MSLMHKISLLAIVSFLGFLIVLNACSFSSKASKKMLVQSQNQSYDMVVVPGVPFENNTWSRIMKARVYWAKYLYDKGIAKNIMFSGSSVASPYYEGEIMALYAKAIGIPATNVFTEVKAEHSTENIYYSYKKAKKLGFTTVALASDPFQTKALKSFVREKVNPNIVLLPIVFDTLKVMEPKMVDPTIDYAKAYNKEFISLKDREGFWKRLRGTRGLNMDTTAYN